MPDEDPEDLPNKSLLKDFVLVSSFELSTSVKFKVQNASIIMHEIQCHEVA